MADLNGDGSMDMAATGWDSNLISVLLQFPITALSAGSLNFGDVTVGSSASQTLTLTNSGSAVLRIADIAASGMFFETNDFPAVLEGGAVCTITVVFAPAAAGIQTGSLSINSNLTGQPQAVSLTGAGL